MSVVYKYEIAGHGHTKLMLPYHAAIIRVASQGDKVYLWAVVEPTREKECRLFEVVFTGEYFEGFPDHRRYVGTTETYDGTLVHHVFEVL